MRYHGLIYLPPGLSLNYPSLKCKNDIITIPELTTSEVIHSMHDGDYFYANGWLSIF